MRKLSLRLKEWTGQRWLIATDGQGGAESIYERDQRERKEAEAAVLSDPFMLELMKAFPRAQMTSFRKKPKPVDTTPVIPTSADETPDKDDD